MTTPTLSRDDFRTVRTLLRWAGAGVLPAEEVADRAALLISDTAGAKTALQVIESVRAGMMPSQVACQAAEEEVFAMFERGERDGAEQNLQPTNT